MKHITILIAMLLLCGTAAANIPDAEHYMIVVLVWDNETGEPEAGVPVTFMYHPYFADEIFTLATAEDGSVVFDIANMPKGVRNDSVIMVSCKYGIKNAPVIYSSNGVRNWGTAVTFNEPDEATVIEILAAMGIIATSIGGGLYLLRRKKKIIKQEDTMTENKEEWKLKRDFGVRALIATLTTLGYIGVSGMAVYQGNMSMLENITMIFMPIMMAIIVFYFNGSTIKDLTSK